MSWESSHPLMFKQSMEVMGKDVPALKNKQTQVIRLISQLKSSCLLESKLILSSSVYFSWKEMQIIVHVILEKLPILL